MPKLIGERLQTFEDSIRHIVTLKGGSIDQNWKFINSKIKIHVKCQKGHQWGVLSGDLKSGKWCPECHGHKVMEDEVRKYVSEKNGEISSNWRYKNNHEKIFIICKNQHTWQATWANLRKGHWCPYCSKVAVEERTVKEFIANKKASIDKNWTLITTRTKFKIVCEKGHTFKSTWDKLHKGHWCPSCYGNNKPDETLIRNKVALKKGRLDLNWKYLNAHHKFNITCEKGHKWQATWANLRKGHWCPHCLEYKTEQAFRSFLEELTGLLFPSTRPDWLFSPSTKRRFQLDGYNRDNKIAFEYQGKQHYELCYTNGYSKETLDEIQKRDSIKKKLCEKQDVRLIIVPYWIKKSHWKDLIPSELLL